MLAKQVPQSEKPARHEFEAVRSATIRLEEAARWLGRITALANHFPIASVDSDGKPVVRHIRDSQGRKRVCTAKAARRKPPVPLAPRVAGDLSQCPRWAAIRQRIAARTNG